MIIVGVFESLLQADMSFQNLNPLTRQHQDLDLSYEHRDWSDEEHDAREQLPHVSLLTGGIDSGEY
jgi:hypothetical protein